MIFTLLASALANPPAQLDGDPWTQAWLVPRNGRAVLLLADSGQPIRVVDPSTGEVLQRLSTTVTDVVVEDLDGDGRRDLLTCGASGLASLPWEDASATLVLSEAPCRAVAIVYAD